MKIYSIKEIVDATNSFLKPKSKNIVKDNDLTKQIKLTNKNQVKNIKESNFKEVEKIISDKDYETEYQKRTI